jgi:hypothetical protein
MVKYINIKRRLDQIIIDTKGDRTSHKCIKVPLRRNLIGPGTDEIVGPSYLSVYNWKPALKG